MSQKKPNHTIRSSTSRTLLKTATWRVISSATTIILVWFFTGSAVLSLSIGAVEFITKTLLYYTHERFWLHVLWGKWIDGEGQ